MTRYCKGKICVEDSCKTHRSTITSSKYRKGPHDSTTWREICDDSISFEHLEYSSPASSWSCRRDPCRGDRRPASRQSRHQRRSLAELPFERLCHDTSVATPCTNPCVRLVGPRSNLRPVFPSFSGTPTCTQFLLRALNVARADEELPAIVLPTNWFQLKPQDRSS